MAMDASSQPEVKSAGGAGFRPPLFGGNVPWVLALDVVLILVFWLFSTNGAFLNPTNINNILITSSQVLLLVVAQTMLLSAGQIDLSQGSNVVLSSVVAGLVLLGVSNGVDPGVWTTVPVMMVVAIGVGAVIGLANGLLVGRLGINSLIATLGTLGIAVGTAQVLTRGDNLYGVPTSIQSEFGIRNVMGMPMATLTAAVIVAVVWILFSRTRFGTHSIAIGSSKKAAERNGVRVARHITWLYVVTGAMCGVGGAFDLARFTTTDIGGHSNDALAAISGAVIGGTSLFGGQAYFTGSILGALLALILQSGLVILNFPPFYQTIAIGIVLIVAVAVDRLKAAADRSES